MSKRSNSVCLLMYKQERTGLTPIDLNRRGSQSQSQSQSQSPLVSHLNLSQLPLSVSASTSRSSSPLLPLPRFPTSLTPATFRQPLETEEAKERVKQKRRWFEEDLMRRREGDILEGRGKRKEEGDWRVYCVCRSRVGRLFLI
jgi:hypothetical protein